MEDVRVTIAIILLQELNDFFLKVARNPDYRQTSI